MRKFERYLHGSHPEHSKNDPYLASEELAGAVNAALAIGRPLLVSGEPGTGKTTLARSIATQLGLGEELRFDTHSDSRWQDCLYSFDALGRLYDAQSNEPRARQPTNYRHFKALGQALTGHGGEWAEKPGPVVQRVVLIDEIDKAPRDFPNGLLPTIDGDLSFSITETRESFKFPGGREQRPIVVFTTNEERSLPDAFLRRCVFCYIDPPDEKRLNEIIQRRLRELHEVEAFEALSQRAVAKFLELRAKYGDKLEKQPATAELLDWVRVLVAAGVGPEQVSVSRPHAAALLKTRNDLDQVLGKPGAAAESRQSRVSLAPPPSKE